jgi:hypothetical protein
MSEATPLSPELSRGVSALARAIVAAARSWTQRDVAGLAFAGRGVPIDPLAYA